MRDDRWLARAHRLALEQHGGSVLAAILFHTTINISIFMFPNYGSHYDPFFATIIIAIVVASVVFLWGAGTLARFRFA